MSYYGTKLVDVIGLQRLRSRSHQLGMLAGIWEEVGILGQPLEALDDEPVLTPQDHEVATAQIIQVRLEVATVVVNRALRRLDQVIERRSFGGPGVLTHDLVEEIDCLVQFQLANVLQMLLAGQRQQPLGRSEEHTSELQY